MCFESPPACPSTVVCCVVTLQKIRTARQLIVYAHRWSLLAVNGFENITNMTKQFYNLWWLLVQEIIWKNNIPQSWKF